MRRRLILGLLVITIGVLILLKNMNIIQESIGSLIADYWPIILILWGLSFIFERTGSGGKIIGSFILLLGVLFLGRNLNWFYVDFSLWRKAVWPVLLILVGIGILTRSFSEGKSRFALMGGIEEKEEWSLNSGSYWAMMGSVELDLRKAEIPDGKTNLNLSALMGGIKVIVPADLTVVCEGTSILGGVGFFNKDNGGIIANLRAEQGDPKNSPKVVRISCFVMMGGIEVRAIDV